jgi:hypothetical protein
MTYNELIKNPDYSLIQTLEHAEMKKLVVSEFRKNRGWSRIAIAYQLIGTSAFAFFLTLAIIKAVENHDFSNLIQFGYGTLFAFTALVIIHEFIHAAAYLLVGARHISFGMQLRKFMFYVLSDKDVVNYNQFKIVALAPAVIISSLSLAVLIIFYNQPIFYFILPIFGLHSVFCGGDFGLLCFFQNRPEQEILTFDVKTEGKTYFYATEKK